MKLSQQRQRSAASAKPLDCADPSLLCWHNAYCHGQTSCTCAGPAAVSQPSFCMAQHQRGALPLTSITLCTVSALNTCCAACCPTHAPSHRSFCRHRQRGSQHMNDMASMMWHDCQLYKLHDVQVAFKAQDGRAGWGQRGLLRRPCSQALGTTSELTSEFGHGTYSWNSCSPLPAQHNNQVWCVNCFICGSFLLSSEHFCTPVLRAPVLHLQIGSNPSTCDYLIFHPVPTAAA